MSRGQDDDKFIKIIYHSDLEDLLSLDQATRRLLSKEIKKVIIKEVPRARDLFDIEECPTQSGPVAKPLLLISNRFSTDGEWSECEDS